MLFWLPLDLIFKTQQTRGCPWVSWGGYIAFTASQTAPINWNSAQGQTAGLIAQGTSGTATAPSSGKISTLRVGIIDDVYIIKQVHDNLFCVIQDRHIVPRESVNALLSVSCISEDLRKPSLILERIWPTFSWIKLQKINELELHTSGNCSISMHNKTPDEIIVPYRRKQCSCATFVE